MSTLSVDLEQRLVNCYGVALLLQPSGDGSLGDALAECGHLDGRPFVGSLERSVVRVDPGLPQRRVPILALARSGRSPGRIVITLAPSREKVTRKETATLGLFDRFKARRRGDKCATADLKYLREWASQRTGVEGL